MPSTPTYGLPYPSATDPVAEGASAIQALALAVDAALVAQARTVWGLVNADGTVAAGSGDYSVAKVGAGRYAITFTPALAGPPAVLASPVTTRSVTGAGNALVAGTEAPLAASVTVHVWDTGSNTNVDKPFSFVAVAA